ncbi:MAG TPA: NUDIX hydrolase [archaeon]|nr:NUDIX hydrolase [archaeon]
MQEKKGVTAVIFSEKNGERFFLILHRVLNWKGWEFVKGGIDEGEQPIEAVLREVSEESGLEKVSIVATLPQKISWTAKGTKYLYTPFILKADMDEPVNLEQEIIEHDAFKWVEEKKVEPFLTHEDNKKIFREALALLR